MTALGSLDDRWRRNLLIALVLLIVAIYVANAWTPSSYQQAAHFLGIETVTPVFGVSRHIRSDEWSVVTPYFQIAVLNDLGPINKLSPFHEPLKAFFSFPSRDWSMTFKPDLWGFLLLDPARAYSLHYAVLALAFVGGFAILLRQFGCGLGPSIAGAAILFFSQFVQVWWTSNPVLAWMPWPFVIFLWRGPPALRFLGMAYAVAVWLIGHLYPPFILSATLGLTILMLAFRLDAFRPWNLAIAAGGGFAGGAIAWLHFADLIPVMSQTVYPGERLSGGGEVHALQLLAHLFPSLVTKAYEPLGLWQSNACEIGVVGSCLPLAAAIFGRPKPPQNRPAALWRSLGVWLAGLLLISAWMLLPVPAEFVPIFNRMPSYRMLLGFGLLFLLGVLILAEHLDWTLTPRRIAVFFAAVFATSLLSKHVLSREPELLPVFDNMIIVVMSVFLLLRRLHPNIFTPRTVVMASVAVTSALTFGLFNPVQSAFPIFARHSSPLLEALRKYAAASPQHWAVADGAFGATINGAGVPAINHVLLQPQLDFMRRAYPSLPAPEFNAIFNRYEHLLIAPGWSPTLPQPDGVLLPADPFAIGLPVEVKSPEPETSRLAGAVDSVKVVRLGPTRWGVTAAGWANWIGVSPGQRLVVALDPGVGKIVEMSAYRITRPDVVSERRNPDLFAAGYGLRLEVESAIKLDGISKLPLSVVAVDDPRTPR